MLEVTVCTTSVWAVIVELTTKLPVMLWLALNELEPVVAKIEITFSKLALTCNRLAETCNKLALSTVILVEADPENTL